MIGYDKHSLNQQLLLGLTFEEMIRTLTHDRSKAVHPHTLHGTPTWASLANGQPYLDFNPANPDWLDCPAAATADLDFTVGDFSLAIWAYIDDHTTERTLFCRGLTNADGWRLSVTILAQIMFSTHQAGANQLSTSPNGTIIDGIWNLIGLIRSGVSGRLFLNGRDVTSTAAAHINPTAAVRELHIGIYDDETLTPMDGRLTQARIWERRLKDGEMLEIFNMERHWFGV